VPVLKAKIDSTWITVGGVGPGVAAGGTTGQLLSKASASDYDTQWTSAPVLTNLSIVDTTTPQLILQRTGGAPPIAWYTQIHTNGSLIIGASSDETQYSMYFDPTGRGAGFYGNINIGSNLTVGGTLTSKHAVRAAAVVNGGDGTLLPGAFGWASAARTGTGQYQLTLATAMTQPIVAVSPWSSTTHALSAWNTSATLIEVRMFLTATGALADHVFHILVVGA
jgi:hypothetical protein